MEFLRYVAPICIGIAIIIQLALYIYEKLAKNDEPNIVEEVPEEVSVDTFTEPQVSIDTKIYNLDFD